MFQPSKLFEKINELPWYQGVLKTWVEDEKIQTQSKVLEIGSATGTLSSYLSVYYAVTAIDYNPKMIARAKERYPHVEFQVADALDLPFNDGTFDLVLASSLINVLDNKEALLTEMLRVCKEDGKLMLLFPLEGFSNVKLAELSVSLKLQGFSKMALKMWHKLAKKMSINLLEALLVDSEFKVLSSKEYLAGMVSTVLIGRKINIHI